MSISNHNLQPWSQQHWAPAVIYLKDFIITIIIQTSANHSGKLSFVLVGLFRNQRLICFAWGWEWNGCLLCLCYRHCALGNSPEHCWSHFIFHNLLLTIKSIRYCGHDGAKLGHVPLPGRTWSEKLTLLLWLNPKLKHIIPCPWLGAFMRFLFFVGRW